MGGLRKRPEEGQQVLMTMTSPYGDAAVTMMGRVRDLLSQQFTVDVGNEENVWYVFYNDPYIDWKIINDT
jgi:hypothetical protein